ncbi:hypothetical protein D3C72_1179370 [compost metagenome]
MVEGVVHIAEQADGVAFARLFQLDVLGAVESGAFGLGLLYPGVEVAVGEAVELERHAGKACTAVVRAHALVHPRLVDHGVELRLHRRHGVDHAGQIRHIERVHRGGGGQLEADRTVHRRRQLVDGGDALLGVDEQPLPVHGDHFHLQRLDIGRNGAVGVHAVQRTVGVEFVGVNPGDGAQRDDDQKRHRPDHQLQGRGVVPFGVVVSGLVRFAVLEGKQQDQHHDRNDDDQHQQGGDDHQIAGLGSNIPGGVEHNGIAARKAGGG